MGISIKNGIHGLLLFLSPVFFIILYGQQPQRFGHNQLWDGSVLAVTAAGTSLATADDGHSYVELSVNRGLSPYQDYAFSISLRITPLLADGSLGRPYALNLSLNYSRNSGSGSITGPQKHMLEGSYIHSIEVLSSSLSRSDGGSSTTVPSNIVLKAGYTKKQGKGLKIPGPKGLGSLLKTAEDFITTPDKFIRSQDSHLALGLASQVLSGSFYAVNPLIHLSNI